VRALDLPEEETERARMTVDFMGVTGPSGVLPHVYSLLLWERDRARDTGLHDFLDLFHHRSISLFYRAWRKQRFALSAGTGSGDAVAAHLLDIAGVGLDAMRAALPVPEEGVAFYAGLLSLQPPGAVALEQVLADYFGVPVEVEQFTGGWSALSPRDVTALSDEDEGASGTLGGGAVVGDEVWDPQAAVRVRLGPLTREQFEAFLPSGGAHAMLRALTRLVSRGQVEVEAQLVYGRESVPALVLGSEREQPRQLGWTTWLRSRPLDRDPDETTFAL
jgi:type VI secretion system protein ImpH